MIDGQTALAPAPDNAAEPAGASAQRIPSTASVATGAAALDAYEAHCRTAVFASPQHPIWIRSWVSSHQPDFIVATLDDSGGPKFALALEIVRTGPFRIARFMGGNHANGNFPAANAEFLQHSAAADFRSLFDAIGKTRPDIDLIQLERMSADLDGFPNPLLALPHAESPDLALELDLRPGFEAICGRSKSLRSKHRSQMRKFEAAGGYRHIEAGTPAEVEQLIEEFFVQKRMRLQQKGIADPFGDPKVRAFFRSLFASSLGAGKPPFVLHGLEVGGKLRAITGASRNAARTTCDLVSISDDDLTQTRPGEFLFHENIRQAAAEGLTVYDFGIGDEPHKRRWCDREIRHVDVHMPLTAKGRALAASRRAAARAKRFIKTNDTLWPLIKRLRKSAARLRTAKSED